MTSNYTILESRNDLDAETGYANEAQPYRKSRYRLSVLFNFTFLRCHIIALRRWWNRLSRLQRYVLCLLGFVFLCILVTFPWISEKSFLHNKGFGRNDLVFYFGIRRQQRPESQEDANSPLSMLIEMNDQNTPVMQDNLDLEKNFFYSENSSPTERKLNLTQKRQRAVISAFLHAWKGYKTSAWGHDHLKPITKTFQDWFGLGLTIVDSLDTMYIMELNEEFNEAKDWITQKLDFKINKDVNFFETTIRVLGGLLSAFHLSKETVFLDKAIDIGNRLMPCFDSATGIPYSDVNLQSGHAHAPSWGQDSTVSEVSTVQLEFRDLSKFTNDKKFEEAAFKVSIHLHHLPKKDGLVPMFINADNGRFRTTSTVTIGARADSYYEYLLKQWIQTGRSIDWLKQDYIDAVNGIMKHLVKQSHPNKWTFIGELLSGQNYSPKMDHLVCYLPGTLALGYHYGLPSSHLQFAERLMETCYNMYAYTNTFLSPEIAYFNLKSHSTNDMIIKSNDAHNLLRPETVESLWYLFHVTQNETYRLWGWKIFQAFERHSKVKDGGYTSIGDVRNSVFPKPRDFMESFFLAETLKYLYLLFSDNQEKYSIDKYIFNSEAHLLPIRNS